PWATSGRPGLVGLVPARRLLMRPRAAGRPVERLDVAQAPADLGSGVALPVRAGAGHLRAGQRLRYAVCPTGVAGVDVPAALLIPKAHQAAELARRPSVGPQHRLGDLLGVP